MNKLYCLLLTPFLIFGCQKKVDLKQHQKVGFLADSAIVVTAHPLASDVGLAVLKKGGNAFDAAVAVQFTLAVVYPVAGNIGGGGFAVFRCHDGSVGALDFREKAPKLTKRDMFLDKTGEVIPDKSTLGHEAAGVPGTVDGMVKLHKKYGSLPFSELVQPAIEIAFKGVVLKEFDAFNLNKYQDAFIEANHRTTYYNKDTGWQAGDTIYHKELAGTLSFIRDFGRDGFYKGIVASQIAAEMIQGGGIMTLADLESYSAVWRTPLEGSYKGYRVLSMPPPSSGGIALIQLLQGAESLPIRKWGHNSVKTIHAIVEMERRVYADRATYLGDPDYYEVPVKMLTDKAYNDERFADINMKAATSSQEIKEGKVDVIESIETTHFSIVDQYGNAVAITTTLNAYFGCKVLVKGAGFFLNNEMDDFSAKPGVPNMFGLVGAEANAIKAEKRMLSSMTPTILEKDGHLSMVIGTPGGSTIITSVFQTIMNVVDHGMSMQEAVNAKKFHHQWLPDRILIESDAINEKNLDKLEALGHEIEKRDNIGKMKCIFVNSEGKLEGAVDPRNYGKASGF